MSYNTKAQGITVFYIWRMLKVSDAIGIVYVWVYLLNQQNI